MLWENELWALDTRTSSVLENILKKINSEPPESSCKKIEELKQILIGS